MPDIKRITLEKPFEVRINGKKMVLTISNESAGSEFGIISSVSPVGETLLGKEIGNKGQIKLPNNKTAEYIIIKIFD